MLPVYLLVTVAFDGTARTPVAIFAAAYFVGSIIFIAIESFLIAAYGFNRKWPWLLVWPFWQVCLTIFSTESWLSLPGRPVSFNPSGRFEVTEAVIH